jgi:hypothetical protein
MKRAYPLSLFVTAIVGCGAIVVRPADESGQQAAPKAAGSAAPDDARRAEHEPKAPQISIADLEPRVADAKAKLASEPESAAKELAAVRAEIWKRFVELERTQPPPADERRMRPDDPFYSDSLSSEAKALLASTHTLRAGLWAERGKVDDALRELVIPLLSVGAVPCTDADVSCERARRAVSDKYKGFCWNFSSSNCSAHLDDDDFAWNKESATLFASAVVRKVIPRGDGVDVLTGDVAVADLEVCKGKFETDKILDVNEKRILIERTTWCKSIEKERRAGWRITHHLGKVATPLRAGDRVLLVADARKVKRNKVGDTVVVDAQSVLLAARSLDGRATYRWNEVTR